MRRDRRGQARLTLVAKFDNDLVAEASKLASLLSAIRPYKGFDGPTNVDRLCKALEKELNRVCGQLMEGTKDDAT